MTLHLRINNKFIFLSAAASISFPGSFLDSSIIINNYISVSNYMSFNNYISVPAFLFSVHEVTLGWEECRTSHGSYDIAKGWLACTQADSSIAHDIAFWQIFDNGFSLKQRWLLS